MYSEEKKSGYRLADEPELFSLQCPKQVTITAMHWGQWPLAAAAGSSVTALAEQVCTRLLCNPTLPFLTREGGVSFSTAPVWAGLQTCGPCAECDTNNPVQLPRLGLEGLAAPRCFCEISAWVSPTRGQEVPWGGSWWWPPWTVRQVSEPRQTSLPGRQTG